MKRCPFSVGPFYFKFRLVRRLHQVHHRNARHALIVVDGCEFSTSELDAETGLKRVRDVENIVQLSSATHTTPR